MFGLGKVTALKHPKPFAFNAIKTIISYRTKNSYQTGRGEVNGLRHPNHLHPMPYKISYQIGPKKKNHIYHYHYSHADYYQYMPTLDRLGGTLQFLELGIGSEGDIFSTHQNIFLYPNPLICELFLKPTEIQKIFGDHSE